MAEKKDMYTTYKKGGKIDESALKEILEWMTFTHLFDENPETGRPISDSKFKKISKQIYSEWDASKDNYNDIQEYFNQLEENGDYQMFLFEKGGSMKKSCNVKEYALGGEIVGRVLTFKDYNGEIREGVVSEQLNGGNYAVTSGFSSVLVTPDMIISQSQQPERKKFLGIFKDGGNVEDESITIYVNEYPYYLQKHRDSTHLRMSNSREGLSYVIPTHIGQYNGTPYYNDIRSWLKGGESPDGKKYTEYFEKGGPIEAKKPDARFLKKISNKINNVWDIIGAQSSGQIRGDKEMLAQYANNSFREMEKLNIKKRSLIENDFNYLTNLNEHLLNEFLIWNDFYTKKFSDEKKDQFVKSFKGYPMSFCDPSIIKVVADDEMYIPHSKIESITAIIDGKKVVIKGEDVLNGIYR